MSVEQTRFTPEDLSDSFFFSYTFYMNHGLKILLLKYYHFYICILKILTNDFYNKRFLYGYLMDNRFSDPAGLKIKFLSDSFTLVGALILLVAGVKMSPPL